MASQILELTARVRTLEVRVFSVKNLNGRMLQIYTGISPSSFTALVDLIDRFELNYYSGTNVFRLTRANQLLLCLTKLKLGVPDDDLAVWFGVSRMTVQNVFMTFLHVLYEVLFESIIEKNFPRGSYSASEMPKSFRDFSNFAPNGAIIYTSGCYLGSTSDREVVKDCGILDQLTTGDLILADKGCTIFNIMPGGTSLNIPPSLRGNRKFTPDEVPYCKKITSCRVHVERAIQRVNIYRVLRKLPAHKRPLATELVRVCSCLANLHSFIIAQ
ncbi:hypothetical protein HPB47_004430 [Ixodes persulcatus]|uniref:Uncharacterized protein n=1 Tax=Ixodes persulcatus TaxID=34615 RepID=A0AC60PFT9_IXOPE|nr:hypothetical protein HPB47_004430 [Ixodes persulcatus]